MATGISKKEQLSHTAMSASQLLPERERLPSSKAAIELTYEGRISPSELLFQSKPSSYVRVEKGGQQSAEALINSFILNDNLVSLRDIANGGLKASLFYLDPPYATGMDFQSRGLEHAYNDEFGTAAYVEFMRRRMILIRECLSDQGSVYVHIGHQMLAHLKIVMDEVFGPNSFRNIITRRKCSSKNFTSNQFANLNDYILFYTKGKSYTWNQPGVEAEEDWILREYPKVDSKGRRYKLVPIHAPGTRNGETGLAWRDMMPPPGKHWQYSPTKLEEFDRVGDIHWSKSGNPRRKVYWTFDKKRSLTDYWDNYRDAHHQSIKISGYPTEKNFDMLTMIVGASSNPGDLVIDPFCGSGTTIQAARDLGRSFIGIDASFVAAKATLTRMRHGTEAMGDYVNTAKSVVPILPGLEVSPKNSCQFLVPEYILELSLDAVNELAKI